MGNDKGVKWDKHLGRWQQISGRGLFMLDADVVDLR